MDTTLAVLMLDTQQALAYWSSLGDSRIYLFRHGRARALTSDHSILQSMIDSGLITDYAQNNFSALAIWVGDREGYRETR